MKVSNNLPCAREEAVLRQPPDSHYVHAESSSYFSLSAFSNSASTLQIFQRLLSPLLVKNTNKTSKLYIAIIRFLIIFPKRHLKNTLLLQRESLIRLAFGARVGDLSISRVEQVGTK